MTKPISHARSRSARGGPPPGPPRPYLEEKTSLRVRFNEVDALHIVWHGHYANYFEDARRAFGRRYGVDYTTFIEHRVAVPIIHLHVDYLMPARLPDVLEVSARLFKSESARLDFDYEVRRASDGALLATGGTSQVFTTLAGELILNWPAFMLERLKAWEPLWTLP
jgi:acyl-CoA thioester hydrolase